MSSENRPSLRKAHTASGIGIIKAGVRRQQQAGKLRQEPNSITSLPDGKQQYRS
jgi:hypothetical protein